ncbi:unnamed protein product [Symbiodinium sp. KB8]|nr:unnamed protein product [Symbiodinium sp. KB8]
MAAFVAGTLSALVMMCLFCLDLLPGYFRRPFLGSDTEYKYGPWALLTGVVVSTLTLFLWRPKQAMFLDRICINQVDQAMKAEGVLNMGAILKHSDSMLVLWDTTFASRLWCLFEMAAFLKSHEDGLEHLRIKPTYLAPCTFVIAFCVMLMMLFELTVPFVSIYVVVMKLSLLALSCITAARLLFLYYSSVRALQEQLRDFRIVDAKCVCCDLGHVDVWLALFPSSLFLVAVSYKCYERPRRGEGPPGPSSAKEAARRAARADRELPSGRPVLPRTQEKRQHLLATFDNWLGDRGTSIEAQASLRPLDPLFLNQALVDYGRELYEAGKPYWLYSETVNALTARLPTLRRQMQQAWDLGFAWLANEPYTHHVPMPPVILSAVLTTCLCWGWVREAGLFALAWGGLLRIGEATNACRRDLVLPRDVLYLQKYVLLRIQEPKTRLRMARHQAARCEPADLVAVIDLAFADLAPAERLWPRSQQTLRRRLDTILERLGIRADLQDRPLDLGSFRPGGATFLLSLLEDSELVRRRGRWASHRVMEIYLQEVSAIVFFPKLPLDVREKVLLVAQSLESILGKVSKWRAQQLPPATWFLLLSAEG